MTRPTKLPAPRRNLGNTPQETASQGSSVPSIDKSAFGKTEHGGVIAPVARKRKVSRENILHRFTHNLLKNVAKKNCLWMHLGNGLPRQPKYMAMLKNMGVRPGAFDWLVIVDGQANWLELKAEGKHPSENQLKFLDDARAAGCRAYVACEEMEVRTILWAWNAIDVLPDTVSPEIMKAEGA